MNKKMRTEEKELQASGYPTVVVLVRPDPKTYYQGVVYRTDTNDTTDEVILDDILRKYSAAWKILAKM